VVDLKALLERHADYLRAMVQSIVQATLEAEITEAIGAEKGERTETRLSYRSDYYRRLLVTVPQRLLPPFVGHPELRVPQDRTGRFSTALFERYQRSEKALVGALSEMYVQGVSTRGRRGWRSRTTTQRCCALPPLLRSPRRTQI
jgi:putative transposase